MVWWLRGGVGSRAYVVVVLLQEDELLLQSFDLTLQVHAAHVGVIYDLPQANDVSLHRLANGQLRLKPATQRQTASDTMPWRATVKYSQKCPFKGPVR